MDQVSLQCGGIAICSLCYLLCLCLSVCEGLASPTAPNSRLAAAMEELDEALPVKYSHSHSHSPVTPSSPPPSGKKTASEPPSGQQGQGQCAQTAKMDFNDFMR